MLLPISDEVPLLLQRLPHPETPELRQFGIGEHVGHDQEQRAAPWTTPLFSAGEVPLTVRTGVPLRPVSQGDPPKICSIRSSSRPERATRVDNLQKNKARMAYVNTFRHPWESLSNPYRTLAASGVT